VTLTLASGADDAGYGRVREFWRRVRQRWLGTRYFCWLELQRSGRVHYTCIWLNPPNVRRVNLLAWVDHAWGAGRTQVRFSDGRRGLEYQLRYAEKYAEKMKAKAYQQRYDLVSPKLRTFMSQRLEIPPKVLAQHRERDLYEFRGAAYGVQELGGGYDERAEAYLEKVGHETHDLPWGARCSAADHRRPKRGPPRARWDLPPAARRPGRRGVLSTDIKGDR